MDARVHGFVHVGGRALLELAELFAHVGLARVVEMFVKVFEKPASVRTQRHVRHLLGQTERVRQHAEALLVLAAQEVDVTREHECVRVYVQQVLRVGQQHGLSK